MTWFGQFFGYSAEEPIAESPNKNLQQENTESINRK